MYDSDKNIYLFIIYILFIIFLYYLWNENLPVYYFHIVKHTHKF